MTMENKKGRPGEDPEDEPLEDEDTEDDDREHTEGETPEGAAAPAQPVAAAQGSVKKAVAKSGFLYPFAVRYGAEVLDLIGFSDGVTYAEAELKELLIQNGYTEFADMDPGFHHSTTTNTVVITIKGSKKGAGYGR